VEAARLSETSFDQRQRHPGPIEDAAIRAIGTHSRALDLDCRLAGRLHVLPASRTITRKALHAQFGGEGVVLQPSRPLPAEVPTGRDDRRSRGTLLNN
jgi:hypothetical protein